MCENEQYQWPPVCECTPCNCTTARLVKRNQSLDGLQVLTFEFPRRADVEAVLGAFVGASARYRTRGMSGEVKHYAVWLADGVVVQAHPTDDRREPIEAPECAPYTVEVPL